MSTSSGWQETERVSTVDGDNVYTIYMAGYRKAINGGRGQCLHHLDGMRQKGYQRWTLTMFTPFRWQETEMLSTVDCDNVFTI